MKAWNAHPVNGMTGDELASAVHAMLLDLRKAVSIPLVVSHAAEGDYAPLERAGSGGFNADLNLMGSSIWCNEPWTGLDAKGPWGTDFDSYTRAGSQPSGGSAAPSRGAPSRARSGHSPRSATCPCSPSRAAPTRKTPSPTSPT